MCLSFLSEWIFTEKVFPPGLSFLYPRNRDGSLALMFLGTTLTLLWLVFEVTGKIFQLAALTVVVPDIYLSPYLFGSWVSYLLEVWDHVHWDGVVSQQLGWQLWPQLWGWPWLCHHPDTELAFPSLSFTSNRGLGQPVLSDWVKWERCCFGGVFSPLGHDTNQGSGPWACSQTQHSPRPSTRFMSLRHNQLLSLNLCCFSWKFL